MPINDDAISMDELHADDPTEVTPTDTVEPTPADPVEPTPVEPADPADPGNPRNTEPTEPAPADPVEPTEPAPADPVDPTEPPADPNDPVASGIEQYLSEHDIEAGMITIDDSEGNEVTKHFNELTDGEQFQVLKTLAEKGAAEKAVEHGLDDDEAGLINWVRSQEGTVEEIIESLAMKRLEEERALSEATGVDYETMSKDALYTKWVKEANPEATDDEVAQEVATAKEGKFYDANVSRIKEDFIRSQKDEAAKFDAREKAELAAEMEEDRALIVNAVVDIDTVSGFDITDDVKNEVLGKLLEVGESGDSVFMEEVFANPEILFKAAVMHYKGDEFLDSLESYYKKEVTNARVRGRSEVVDGMPTKPIQGRTTPNSKPADKPTPAPRGPERISLDDLHAE